jgi:hypothetical protein
MSGKQQWQPVLGPSVDPSVRNSIKVAFRYLYRLRGMANDLENAGYVTGDQADAQYGPEAMTDALSASGSNPLNVQGLVGVLAQPQLAGAPVVTSLPALGTPAAQDGALVYYNGLLYRFDGPSGTWQPVTGGGVGGAVPTTRLINTTLPLTGGGDLSADRTLAVNTMTGDTGSGGARGVVPAPAAGDAAAGKFLKADGTWAITPGAGGGFSPGGDLSGTSTSQTVIGLEGKPLDAATVGTPSNGQVITYDSASGKYKALAPTGGGGTVTSVGMTVPPEFAVSPASITTSGTFAITKATETANTVWAGPASGVAAAPTFRAVVSADIPASLALTGTPTAPTATTGTNTTQVATTAYVQSSIGGLPTAVESANTVLSGPATGAAAAPTFRALVAGDIPGTLNPETIVSTAPGSTALTLHEAPGQTADMLRIENSSSARLVSVTSNGVIEFGGGQEIYGAADYIHSTGGLACDDASGVKFSDASVQTTAYPGVATEPANTVLSGPTTGAAAAPAFRALVSADVPASLALTGSPTAPTPTAGDNSTKVATTAFVATSFAPLASPALTGTPTAPTATTGTNTTQVATTAFVQSSISGITSTAGMWFSPTLTANLIAPNNTAAHWPGYLSIPAGMLVDLSASTGDTLLDIK